jgi:hypothetical protein
MRVTWLLLLVAGAAGGDDLAGVPATPLRIVELEDREGVATKLAGFYRLSGEDLFRGFLGSGEIEVPYERAVEIRVLPARAGQRMRAQITLRSGNVVDAAFDEREGEQLLSGYAPFGRVTISFRDLRRLRFLGHTTRDDLPDYGGPVEGLDVRLTDSEGLATELIGFRRAVGENVILAAHGAASLAIPLRILRRLEITEDRTSHALRGAASFRDGSTLDVRFPTTVEETAYRGEAEFGTYRIRLGKVRDLIVHRETPVLRELVPVAAGDGSGAGALPER